jgi:8-hydroxy-5-deazaflavin:NADPH oxidoreductase
MKVGILGSGVVGQSLGEGFVKSGGEAMIGTRNPEKLVEWKQKVGEKASVGSFEESSKFGEMIVLAVKGTAEKEVLKMCEENLDGKVIIDATNPISDAEAENGVLKFFTSLDKSLMEELQEEFPKARFVKAFNSIGNAFMVNPDFPEGKPTMFICGNDDEPLCMLWCIPGFLRNEWGHAFKLLKK